MFTVDVQQQQHNDKNNNFDVLCVAFGVIMAGNFDFTLLNEKKICPGLILPNRKKNQV